MGLLWRGSKEDGSLSQFNGSMPTDVHKFFFLFGNVAKSGKSDEEREYELPRHLEVDAFDFFYKVIVKNRGIRAGGSDYQKVKNALVERFASFESPQDVIRDAMVARLLVGDLSGSLSDSDCLNEKAGLKDEGKV